MIIPSGHLLSNMPSLTEFISTPITERLSRERQNTARAQLLELFKGVVQDVPAYREFLAAQGVDPAAVTTYEDFARLPLVTKQNYIHAYPLPARCRGGSLAGCEM